MNREEIVDVLPRIWGRLSILCGDFWPVVEHELWVLLGRLEAGDTEAAALISEVLQPYRREVNLHLAAEVDVKFSPSKGGAATSPAATSDMGRYVVVPVMYGTDRMPSSSGYGNEPGDGGLSLGVANVSIPEDHRMGEFERPRWWKLEFGWDPAKHVTLLGVDRLLEDEFVARTRETLSMANRKEALIFIHGFNVTFADAARRAAQLAYDLRFPGIAMLYSWPSKAKLSKSSYMADADKVTLTRPRLQRFLELVMKDVGLERVHVLAHSMGNQALTDVLKDIEFSEMPQSAASLSQVVFAAPDVNARTFQDLAAQFWRNADRCTLYASSRDKALKYSKDVNDAARAGDSGGRLIVTEGIDTIDVTAVDTSLLGHSFYGDNDSVLADLDLLIRNGDSPIDRPRLEAKGPEDRRYWVFRP